MNNEFYEHKKSDAVKWIIVFVLIGVLFAGMIASLVMSAPDKIEETEGGVNVEYTYAFITRKRGQAFMIFRVEDNDKAIDVLEKHGIHIVSQEELDEL